MIERERSSNDVAILHRMITYLREEAIRLRLMDVAVLLEHAQEAVTTFAPIRSQGQVRHDAVREADRIEH